MCHREPCLYRCSFQPKTILLIEHLLEQDEELISEAIIIKSLLNGLWLEWKNAYAWHSNGTMRRNNIETPKQLQHYPDRKQRLLVVLIITYYLQHWIKWRANDYSATLHYNTSKDDVHAWLGEVNVKTWSLASPQSTWSTNTTAVESSKVSVKHRVKPPGVLWLKRFRQTVPFH